MKKILLTHFGYLLLLLSACTTSPLGRKQFCFLQEEQMQALGSQAFQELKAKIPIEKDPQINAYVQCIALPIIVEVKSKIPLQNWEIVVFKDKAVNAFALPGGKIGVYTGLLSVALTNEQLAAVLGHEIGHVMARHSNERVSEALALDAGLSVANALAKNTPQRETILALLGAGAHVGVMLPHSRTQESEADKLGIDYMAQAGFDPQQSIELWKNMGKAGGQQPLEFLSTHPSHETRITNLQSALPQATQLYTVAKQSGKNHPCQRPPNL